MGFLAFRFPRKPNISPLFVTCSLLGLFVALPLHLGYYGFAFLGIPGNTPLITIVGAVAVQSLFFYVEVLCIAVVVARSGLGPIQRVLGTVLPLVAAFFWVSSYLSLSSYGHFISFRVLGALVNVDAQISHHISATEKEYLVGLVVGTVLVGVGLRILLSHACSPSDVPDLRKRKLVATLAVALCVVPHVELTRRGSFAEVMRSVVSPEFFAITDLYQFVKEATYFSPGSFTPIPTPVDWARTDTSETSTRPDVYIIVVEALRGDVLSPQNNPEVVVPHLYAFACKSWSYSRAYAGAPDTGYALETIVTGAYPYHGPLRHTSEVWKGRSFPHLYDLLHQIGYRTGFFSATNWRSTARLMQRPSLDVYYDPSRLGESLGEGLSSARRPFPEPLLGLKLAERSALVKAWEFDKSSTEYFLAWMQDRSDAVPNFGLLYFVSSHYPWHLPEDAQRLYPTKLQDFPLMFGSSGSDLRRYEPDLHYKNALHQTDKMLGEVLHKLEEQRAQRRSIIVLVGDHGEALGEHNQISHTTSLYEEQVRVPLLINDGRSVSDSPDSRPTSQVDIAPTILEMIRAPQFPGHQGRSLAPGSKIEEYKPRKLFLTVQGLTAIDGVVEWPLKAIIDAPTERVSLFNLEEDPEEARDLAEALPDQTARLASDIKEFQNLQRSYYSIPSKDRATLAPARFD